MRQINQQSFTYIIDYHLHQGGVLTDCFCCQTFEGDAPIAFFKKQLSSMKATLLHIASMQEEYGLKADQRKVLQF